MGVKDGCAIMTSGLQCIYNEGRGGKKDCDFLLIDMRNAYGEVSRCGAFTDTARNW